MYRVGGHMWGWWPRQDDMANLRLAHDEDRETEIRYQTKQVVAVIGISVMFCLLWLLFVSALYHIVRFTLWLLFSQDFTSPFSAKRRRQMPCKNLCSESIASDIPVRILRPIQTPVLRHSLKCIKQIYEGNAECF